MTNDDISELFTQITSGLFETDRIYIDKKFGPNFSALRYVNWISDEINKGAKLYKLLYNRIRNRFFSTNNT